VLVATTVALAVGFRGIDRKETVEAGEFVLKDGQGRSLARLALNAEGLPSLVFYDTTGKRRIQLDAGDVTDLSLFDAEEHFVATLNVTKFGTASFTLDEPDGNRVAVIVSSRPENRAEITLGPAGVPKIWMADWPPETFLQFNGTPRDNLDGEPRALRIASEKDGASRILFRDPGKDRLVIERSAAGKVTLNMTDQQGRPVFKAPNE
jgi:hypothetical protein